MRHTNLIAAPATYSLLKSCEVVVGMSYEDSNSESPSRQWCYVRKQNASGAQTQVTLANKVGPQRIDDVLTLAKAREIDASMEILKAAQRRCAFE